MSQQRRNSSADLPPNAQEELGFGARVVAIPKPHEQARKEEEPIIVPELEAEPESAPKREPIVVLQEPKRESRNITNQQIQEQRPLPKSQKQMQPSDRVGDILRAARLERGDDLYLIAEYLCIKPSFLIAIENSRYDEFPADAYVVGFLKSYANLLGIDGKDAVDRYRYEMAGRRKKPLLLMPTPVTEGRAPSTIIMVGAFVAALLIYALWYGISSSNRAELHTSVSPPVVASPPAPDANAAAGLTAPVASPSSASAPLVPMSSSTLVPAEAPAGIILNGTVPPPAKDDLGKAAKDDKPVAAAAKDVKPVEQEDAKTTAQTYGDAGNSRIVIRAAQSSWIMVTDDSGKTLFDHVLKPGESYKVPNKTGLSLTTGNGSGIVLSLDGKDLPKIATGSPHVVRNITLDPDRLATEAAAQ